MCGIVAAIRKRNVIKDLMIALKALEYRGYDSSGIAFINQYRQLNSIKLPGRISKIEPIVKNFEGQIAIGHTRWATHGKVNKKNSHPHCNGNIALVHNGIIENYHELYSKINKNEILSECDSEVILHLLNKSISTGKRPEIALREVSRILKGSFALGIIFSDYPDQIFATCFESSLAIGSSNDGTFFASDWTAISDLCDSYIQLQDHDIAIIRSDGFLIYDANGRDVKRKKESIPCEAEKANGKNGFNHYMEKEIFQQPEALKKTIDKYLHPDGRIKSEKICKRITEIARSVESIVIVGCGTSYHAACIAKYWIEEYSQIPCEIDIASEWRYRPSIKRKNALFLAISQSGETADTMAALRNAEKREYLLRISISNREGSGMTRLAEISFITEAGLEIGVCSTKCFTAQLVALQLLVILLSPEEIGEAIGQQLLMVPDLAKRVLTLNSKMACLAKEVAKKEKFFFLGRGQQFPLALEGALKLKEISYLSAQAYPGGELKHGPLALIDHDSVVIALMANDLASSKLVNNLKEIQARQGSLVVFSDETIDLSELNATLIKLPHMPVEISPIIQIIPLQLLAYHLGVVVGAEIDQPRNLAKCVTVE